MNSKEIITKLKSLGNKKNVEGMARFGINPKNTFGVSVPNTRNLAKEINNSKDEETRHRLAQELWNSGIHEARILASMIDVPLLVTEKQMDSWVKDFDSWDVCDQVCMNLFDKTKAARKKIFEWSRKKEEFEKRAAFSLIASIACHDKQTEDKEFMKFFPLIVQASSDERNFVRKAVNWALRQLGKKNLKLNQEAIKAAKKILKQDSKAAKWIASDALRELQSQAVKKRL